jgi:hypothetical protein
MKNTYSSLLLGIRGVLLVVLCTLGLGFSVNAGGTTITTFDAPGAGTAAGQGTTGFGINPAGAITGFYIDASSVQHGFVRAPNGIITEFDPTGSIFTNPNAIDQTGAICLGPVIPEAAKRDTAPDEEPEVSVESTVAEIDSRSSTQTRTIWPHAPPLVMQFIVFGIPEMRVWKFNQYDRDYFPSIPHGHHTSKKLKLDAYRGWIYEHADQVAREPRTLIVALWNDDKFRQIEQSGDLGFDSLLYLFERRTDDPKYDRDASDQVSGDCLCNYRCHCFLSVSLERNCSLLPSVTRQLEQAR